MQRFFGLCLLATLMAAVMLGPRLVHGQDASLASYNGRLDRIEQLQGTQMGLADFPDASCADCYDPCCDPCCAAGGYYGLYEHVIVEPYFSRNAAFYVIDDPPGAGPESFSEIPFEWDLRYSPRVEFGYLNNSGGVGWRVRYWYFDHSSTRLSDGEEIVAGFGGSDGIDVELEEIDTGGEVTTAIHSLDLNVLDAEVSFDDGDTTYSAGLRYAQMDQQYLAFTETDLGIIGEHDFEGLGLTMAVEHSKVLYGPWSVFAKARGSILFGDSTFFAGDIDDNFDETLRRSNANDLLPIGELQVGLDWRCLTACGLLFATVAVEAQYWWNAGTGLPGRVDDDDGNYLDEGAQSPDMGFLGLTIGTGLIY